MVRCEWTTPLGLRVVPEVKPMSGGRVGIDGERRREAARRRAGWRTGVAAAGQVGGGVSPTTSQGGADRGGDEQLLVHGEVVGVAEPVGGDDTSGWAAPRM